MREFTNLGRYELRRVLGKGAMGVVYEGFDPSLYRSVAIKTIQKSIVTDQETAATYSARFVREAKAAARLSHSNIVQVYDFGEQNDVAYLVMEFIQGRELRGCFEARERFDNAEAVRIMGELLDALEFAHEAGVIHRDVKPANVMLDAQRRVKLADFGVARMQEGTDRSKSGTLVGTPAFMSPEQISGGRVDRRTDVFSAGIVLYQLLTGEQPFKGEGAWTVVKQILQEEPPRPSTIATRVSPEFDQIVNRALAKRPDQRFASAKDFSTALRGVLTVGGLAAGAARGSDFELEFWRSIQNSTDPAEFEVYLKEFPAGVYADLARIKIAKLPRFVPGTGGVTAAPAQLLPARDTEEVSKLAEEKARLEAEIARREADYQKREAEAAARAAAEEQARLAAIEKSKQDAEAELLKREAEYRRREAEAAARAEAEATARRRAEEKAKREADARAKADAEARARDEAEEKARQKAEARARADAEAKARKDAEVQARRDAEIARREAELRKREAAGPQKKAPVFQIIVAFIVVVTAAIGAHYWTISSDEARVTALTAALDAATKASQELDRARQRQAELRKQVEVARLAEDHARARGDQERLKELQEQTKRAEAEAQKQNELVKQREVAAKKAEDATKTAEARKQADAAKEASEKAAQERIVQEKSAQEKAAQEKAAAEKLVAEKAFAEKAAAEKLAAGRALAEKRAVEKAATSRAAAAGARPGWPSVGERWVYEALEKNRPDRKMPLTVVVQEVTSSSVRESVSPGTGSAAMLTHSSDVMLTSVSPGIAILSPYLSAFQELREDTRWPVVDYTELWDCFGQTYCSASARVVGRERVTVPAGTYDAWKILVDLKVRMGSSHGGTVELVYWYSDVAKRFVKYQSRMNVNSPYNFKAWVQPDIDMELVSYVSAAAAKQVNPLPAARLSGQYMLTLSIGSGDWRCDKIRVVASIEVPASGSHSISGRNFRDLQLKVTADGSLEGAMLMSDDARVTLSARTGPNDYYSGTYEWRAGATTCTGNMMLVRTN